MLPKAHRSTSKRPKVHIHVRVDEDLVDWIDDRIEQMTYKDRSHAVNFALKFLKDNSYRVEEILPITDKEWREAEERAKG